MIFKVLGPLEVAVGDGRAQLPRSGQRVLLAALVLNGGKVVPVEELLGYLWGEDLPDRPRDALYCCTSRLRRWLGRQDPRAAGLLRTSSGGYVLETDADHLDLLRFREHLREAGAAADRADLAARSAALSAALALWRGPVLANVRSEALQRDVAPRLIEEYLQAVEGRCEVGLALGEHDGLVGELRALTDRYPFRERFWRQLMVALYRSGRRIEALEAYGRVSARLREEFGVDPDPELSRLRVAILREDPAPAAR